MGGFAFVLAAIVYQASKGAQNRVAAEAMLSAGVETELAIPKEATINSLALDGDRLALHLSYLLQGRRSS